MKKKGFTLVELLAVIAILAILVIIAMPNVLEMFNKAKQDAFETEVQSHVKAVTNEFITTGKLIYSNVVDGAAKLPMDGEELDYYIELDTKGNIKELNVTNGDYKITATGSSENPVKAEQVGDTLITETAESGQQFEMNANGVIVEKDGDTLVLKKVKIDDKEYNYVPGMTWAQWYASEYNTLPGDTGTYRDVIWLYGPTNDDNETLRSRAEFCLFDKGYMYVWDEVYLDEEIIKDVEYFFNDVGEMVGSGYCRDGEAYYDEREDVKYDMQKKVYHE